MISLYMSFTSPLFSTLKTVCFPVSDEKYAYELHLQEALAAIYANHNHSINSYAYASSSGSDKDKVVTINPFQSSQECGESSRTSSDTEAVCLICMDPKQPEDIFANHLHCQILSHKSTRKHYYSRVSWFWMQRHIRSWNLSINFTSSCLRKVGKWAMWIFDSRGLLSVQGLLRPNGGWWWRENDCFASVRTAGDSFVHSVRYRGIQVWDVQSFELQGPTKWVRRT